MNEDYYNSKEYAKRYNSTMRILVPLVLIGGVLLVLAMIYKTIDESIGWL